MAPSVRHSVRANVPILLSKGEVRRMDLLILKVDVMDSNNQGFSYEVKRDRKFSGYTYLIRKTGGIQWLDSVKFWFRPSYYKLAQRVIGRMEAAYELRKQ